MFKTIVVVSELKTPYTVCPPIHTHIFNMGALKPH